MKHGTLLRRILFIVVLALLLILGSLMASQIHQHRKEVANHIEKSSLQFESEITSLEQHLKTLEVSLHNAATISAQNIGLMSSDDLTRYNARHQQRIQLDAIVNCNIIPICLTARHPSGEVTVVSSSAFSNHLFMLLYHYAICTPPEGSEDCWMPVMLGTDTFLTKTYTSGGYTYQLLVPFTHIWSHGTTVTDSHSETVILASASDYYIQSQAFPDDIFWDNVQWTNSEFYSTSSDTLLFSSQVDAACFTVYQIALRSAIPVSNQFSSFFIPFISVIGVFLLVLIAHMIYTKVYGPTNQLLIAIQALQNGDMNYRIDVPVSRSEFDVIMSNFNTMLDQISAMRIAEYENRLAYRQQQLSQLRSQIKTHFYLNIFTSIQSMTYSHRDDDIRKCLSSLAKHMRYMMQINHPIVTLEEELSHIHNYFSLQEIRFSGSVNLSINMDAKASQWPVPYLSLFTIAENSVKHAMTLEKPLNVTIECAVVQSELLQIQIRDNGRGFPQQILDCVANATFTSSPDSSGHHVGLANIIATLNLIYGQQNLMHICNEQGAVVELTIPYTSNQLTEETL